MTLPTSTQAIVLGCAGPSLTAEERAFFRETTPLGFILFRRNCESPEQVRRLVDDLRDSVGRADAPILIDQEGGRVLRLRAPQWWEAPPAGRIGAVATHDSELAKEAARLAARLIAAQLHDLGITVDCAPCLDLHLPQTHESIGDRSYGADPAIVGQFGEAACEGFRAGGVMPVIKHIPGHGRALVDSHEALPVADAALDVLQASDFAPFRTLAAAQGDGVWGMTCHLVFTAVDADRPATQSRKLIESVIRGHIGFDGVLASDDISMKALSGSLAERTAASLEAGCDLVLHCNGKMEEMQEALSGCRPLDEAARARITRSFAALGPPEAFDFDAGRARLDEILGG